MWIVGVTTGAEFENLMINSLRRAGMTVHDTPASNDYGADIGDRGRFSVAFELRQCWSLFFFKRTLGTVPSARFLS